MGEQSPQTVVDMNDLVLQRDERTILNGASLRISGGEQWVILGRNGSGKTTLLEMMTGYMFPTSGTVDVLGSRFGECDVREVRKRIGYISQSLIEKLSLSDPVWEVVATGEYAFLRFYQEIPEQVRLKAVGLLHEVGLGAAALQPFGTLSQGERKKVLLARALMSEPELLIMDEPCSGLDLYEREKLLLETEKLASRRMTVIYVTHHMEEIMPMFSHVALIADGEVIAAGPKTEVLTPEVLSRAYGLPLEVDWSYGRPWLKVKPESGGIK
ncbi:ABC transporter ATP-binding protein [Paenibacillus beijingensis]|uniref:Molybdenum ABC transporter ATP-binding protein n=1 Tax=Paenibacillus beijingensis TaxID=1126833 RepID=A0A0D5NQ48_9BACL|nr:ATP-binding cassette domain-containing protein [Paenibacillus beijingensis]AJY77063.1 molybdenum ABC transporter ATP-binding protein [Paenibacillus beijingensis]